MLIRFTGQRLLQIAIVAFAIIFFVHLGMQMMNNPARVQRRSQSANMLAANGRVAWTQTKSFFGDAVEGNLGSIGSRRGQIPVREILADTYFKSMGLLGGAMALSLVVGLVLGTMAALAKRSPWVVVLLTLTIIGISTPSFFAALFLQIQVIRIQQVFGLRLAEVGGFGWDKHMILPVLVLAARPIAYLTRAVYQKLESVLSEDYIRTAYAKGLNRRQVVNYHAMRNIAVPLLTALGVSIRFSLGSLPIVEYFFGWPGMGDRLIEAIQLGQTQVVVVLALAIGLTLLFVNLVLDIAYRFIDPRLQALD